MSGKRNENKAMAESSANRETNGVQSAGQNGRQGEWRNEARGNDNGPTLVIDTTYGMTVGVVGEKPLYEEDSRSHVEKLEPLVNAAVRQVGLTLPDISTIVSLIGPGPFTGLRAGVVFAKATAFATGARLIGQNILEPQAWWNPDRTGASGPQLVLAVNNARRKQLYYQLFAVGPADFIARVRQGSTKSARGIAVATLCGMGIDSAQTIAQKVTSIIEEAPKGLLRGLPISVVGHGAGLTPDLWESAFAGLCAAVDMCDTSVAHAAGARGLEIIAQTAFNHAQAGDDIAAIPLYLRRPDAQLPPPLKRATDGVPAACAPAVAFASSAEPASSAKSAPSAQSAASVGAESSAADDSHYQAEAPIDSHEVAHEVADALIWTQWSGSQERS